MNKTLTNVVLLGVLGGGGLLGYQLAKSNISADIYQERLVELNQEHEQLRDQYNEAVRKTAVTELLVEGDQVCVSVRTAEGEVKQIATPYSARNEIYVDYVVVDGRLWIRRVFDEKTAPGRGIIVDPKLGAIDWENRAMAHGKAAYRRLSEGRWAVTVSGDGSLGLARVGENEQVELISAPEVREYEPVDKQAAAEVDKIGPVDVLRHFMAKVQ